MGSVGIAFGSPTSGQGFDVSTTVSAIVANLQAVETPWKNQLTALQAQDTALTSIGKDLSSLSTALNALNDFTGVFEEKEGSSSDTSVLALTSASAAAVAGSHTVVVGQVAETYSYASGVVGASDTLSGSLSIGGQKITMSDGTATDSNGNTIPANNTLATLATYINDGDYGVQANVVTGTGGEQLSLVSDTSGAAGAVTIDSSQLQDGTGAPAVSITQAQKGQDAQLMVDGISTTSASNTVTDAIPGVTMQLLSAPANGEQVQVEITNNNSDVESAVSTFVTAYNTVIGDLNTQEGSDSSGNPEPLYGNSAIAAMQEQLQEALVFSQSSGAITSLSQLGISVAQDGSGTLTLDGSTLDSMLNSNFQDAMNFFQTSSSYTSFGGNFTTMLNNLGNAGPTGAVYLALQQNSTEESGLNTNITNENKSISAQQTQLTTELNAANYTLQEIPEELQSVNELYSAITGYDENPGG
ncbi:MAG: flagellar filament capping protein FliD [Acidobacteriaceae bacterium]